MLQFRGPSVATPESGIEVLGRRLQQRLPIATDAPSVPLIARDAFVAELLSKIEKMQAEISGLRSEMSAAKTELAALREDGDQGRRLQRFLESEQRSRTTRADEMLRRCRDLQARLDRIDGRSSGDYHAFMSFEAISKRLTELGENDRKFRDVERRLRQGTWLFCASVFLWLLAVVAF